MSDRERRPGRGKNREDRDRYFEPGKRWFGSGYWTNEPGFQEARGRMHEVHQQTASDYDDEDVRRYSREAADQLERSQKALSKFENDEFYANRGWTRSAAVETDRDWASYGNRDFSRDSRLEIDFNKEPADRSMRSARELGRGMDAMREKASDRATPPVHGEERGEHHSPDWQKPGPFSSVGPQGNQRSDERIAEEVCERLTRHSQIDASGIEVRVENGEVILQGEVNQKYEKRMAEDVAASIRGVKDVSNQVRVSQGIRREGSEEILPIDRIYPGMRVTGIDGKHIGSVREVRRSGFVLEYQGRSMVVPFTAIRHLGDTAMLSIGAGQVDRQEWQGQ